MNYKAIYFALLMAAAPVVGYAATSTDIYSESITRQLSSAEVPKSFESNARHASVASTGDTDVDSAMDSRIVESAITADYEDEAPAIVETASKKAPKKAVKKARR